MFTFNKYLVTLYIQLWFVFSNLLPPPSKDVEKELQLQISMKQEMEVALRLLEKDIHEKQDTVIALRKQLDDVKHINLEKFNKLQVLFNGRKEGVQDTTY